MIPARKTHNTSSPPQLTPESIGEIIISFLISKERRRSVHTTYSTSNVLQRHGIVKPNKMKKLKKKRRSTASSSSASNQGPSDSNSSNNANNNGLAAVNVSDVSTNTTVAAPTENRGDESIVCESLVDSAESSADTSLYNLPDAEDDRKKDESLALSESLLEFMNPGQDSYINPLSKVPNHGINENPIAFALINSEETISDENNPITYGYSSQMIFIEEKLLPYAGGSYETASSVAGGEGQPPPHPVTIPRMLGNGPSLLDLRLPSNVLEYILELLRTNSGPGSVLNEKVAQSEKDEKEAKDFDIFNPHHDHHDHHDKNDDDYDYNLN